MGTDNYLLCLDCFDFIDLHKWSLGLGSTGQLYVSTRQVIDAGSPCPKRVVTSAEISEAGSQTDLQHDYIQKLQPLVAQFASSHRSHTCCIANDVGDLPWEASEPGFERWRVLNLDSGHDYLPRNLVESGFTEWEQVVAELTEQGQTYFKYAEDFTKDLAAIRQAFEALLFSHGLA